MEDSYSSCPKCMADTLQLATKLTVKVVTLAGRPTFLFQS